jgi:hypothetical protein
MSRWCLDQAINMQMYVDEKLPLIKEIVGVSSVS